jgi:hypothetical protein
MARKCEECKVEKNWIHCNECYNLLEEKVNFATEVIESYGGYDGAHHKQWVLTEVLKKLLGEEGYKEWKEEFEKPFTDEDGEEDWYIWKEGIPP